MKKTISLLLAFVLVFGLWACGDENTAPKGGENAAQAGKPVSGDFGVKVSEVGTLEGRFSFVQSPSPVLTQTVDGGFRILDLDGKDQLGKVYEKLEATVANGLCVVLETDSEGVPRLGLVNAYTGKELLPCEAVEVRRLNDRYLVLGYMTGSATKDDCFSFYADYANNYELVYYQGYGKVFDLESNALVPNVEVKGRIGKASAAGNILYVEDAGDALMTTAYAANGSELGKYEYMNVYAYSDLALQSPADGVHVFDGDGKEKAVLPGSIRDYKTVEGSSQYLIKAVEANGGLRYVVIDTAGQEVSAAFDNIFTVYEDTYVCFYTQQDSSVKTGIAAMDGTVLVEAEYDHITYCEPGWYVGKKADGYYLLDSSFKLVNEKPMEQQNTATSMVLYNQNPSQLLVAETGALLPAAHYSHLTLSLVKIDNAVVDVISGNTVLSDVDDCVAIGNNLYVWDQETQIYTRYVVEYEK